MRDIDNFKPLTIKIVKRLPRKKDNCTIYLKETSDGYKQYIWHKQWWLIGELLELYERDGIVYVYKDDIYTQI